MCRYDASEPRAVRAQVRLMLRGADTVLTDAASPQELFASAHLRTMCARTP